MYSFKDLKAYSIILLIAAILLIAEISLLAVNNYFSGTEVDTSIQENGKDNGSVSANGNPALKSNDHNLVIQTQHAPINVANKDRDVLLKYGNEFFESAKSASVEKERIELLEQAIQNYDSAKAINETYYTNVMIGFCNFELGKIHNSDEMKFKYFLNSSEWLKGAAALSNQKMEVCKCEYFHAQSLYELGQLTQDNKEKIKFYSEAARIFEDIKQFEPYLCFYYTINSYMFLGEIEKKDYYYSKCEDIFKNTSTTNFSFNQLYVYYKLYADISYNLGTMAKDKKYKINNDLRYYFSNAKTYYNKAIEIQNDNYIIAMLKNIDFELSKLK